MPPSRRLAAFTLVELMVVIGIVGILLGVLFSANGMFTGSSVNVSTRMLCSQLNLARQYAVTKRKTIAVVFPDTSSTNTGSIGYTRVDGTTTGTTNRWSDILFIRKQLSDHWFTCFGFVEVSPQSSGSPWKSSAQVAGTAWEMLPTGSAIVEVMDGSHSFWPGDSNGSNAATPTVSVADPTVVTCVDAVPMAVDIRSADSLVIPDAMRVSLNKVKAVVFKPNGALANNGTVYVSVGADTSVFDPETGMPYWIKVNKKNCTLIEVNQYTGKARAYSQ